MRLTSNSSYRSRFPFARAGFGALAALSFLALVTPTTPHRSPIELTSTPVAVSNVAVSNVAVSNVAVSNVAVSNTALSAAIPDPIAAAVAAAQGPPGAAQLGIAVLDRTTGKLTLGRLGAVPFLSASVVKLLTAVDILRRAEVGAGTVNPAQRALVRRALSTSDDTAMAALWSQFGGPRTVTELAGWAHLRDTRPPVQVRRWEETKVSARDVVGTYTYLFAALNAVDRQFVLDALRSASPQGADGFDQSFGMLAPPRRPGAAAKQGWMMIGPSEYLHSTGLIGQGDRYVVVVLTKRPAVDGFDGGRAGVTTAVARVVSALTLTPTPVRPTARPGAHPPAAHPPARPAPRHVPYPVLRTTPHPAARP